MVRGRSYGRAFQVVADDKKLRTCLRCTKEFMSLGKQNRICPDCNNVNYAARDLLPEKSPPHRRGKTPGAGHGY